MFMHHPPQEMKTLANNNMVHGQKGEEICCQALNTGVVAAAVDSDAVGNVVFGHNCNNDFHGYHHAVELLYAR